MRRTQRIGLTIVLVCVVASASFVSMNFNDLITFWKLGSIPTLEVERVFREESLGKIVTRVELTLTNPGARDLFYFGFEGRPILLSDIREKGGSWERLGGNGAGMEHHTLGPEESLHIRTILLGKEEERISVGLARSERSAEVEFSTPVFREADSKRLREE